MINIKKFKIYKLKMKFLVLCFFCCFSSVKANKIALKITTLNNSQELVTENQINSTRKFLSFVFKKNLSQDEVINYIVDEKLFMHYAQNLYNIKIQDDYVNQYIQYIQSSQNLPDNYYEQVLKANNINYEEYKNLMRFNITKQQYFIQNNTISEANRFLQILFSKYASSLVAQVQAAFKMNENILDLPKIKVSEIVFHKKDLQKIETLLKDENSLNNPKLKLLENIKINTLTQKISKYKHSALLLSMPILQYSDALSIDENYMVIYYMHSKEMNLDSKIINIIAQNLVTNEIEKKFSNLIINIREKTLINKMLD